MKLALQVLLATALAVPVVDANAKDYQLRHQSLAALATHSEVKATSKEGLAIDPMPTIEHQKKAGNGYEKKSPLYDRQQAYLTSSTSSTTAAPANNTWFGIPMDQESGGLMTLWWKSFTDIWTFAYFVIYFILQILFIFAIGWFYHTKQHEPWMNSQQRRELKQRREDYERNKEKGTLSFPSPFGDGEAAPVDYCLMACCCWPLRWAETMTADPRSDKRPIDFLKNFFSALAFVVVCQVLNFWTLGLSGLILWGAAVYGRTRLRKIHGIDPSSKSLFIDCCCWYGPCINSCLPCAFLYATVEEAKLVDRKAEVPQDRLTYIQDQRRP